MASKKQLRRVYSVHIRLSQYRMDETAGFIDHSRAGMKSEWKKFSDRFDSVTKSMDADAVDDYVNILYDEMAQLRDISPAMNRHAHCMIVYGAFESCLGNLCRMIDAHKKVATKLPNQLHMDDIKNYLKSHVAKYAFGKEWQWMYELRILRNWIAHNGAKAERSNAKGSRWITTQTFRKRNSRLFSITDHDDILIEDGLIDRAIEKSNRALATMHRAAKRLYQ
jgi:hypothetical protein